MKNPLVMHVEDSKGYLCCPVNNLRLLQFLASLIFLLLGDELVKIPSCAELHDDIEFLAFDDGLAIRDNVDMLEGLK